MMTPVAIVVLDSRAWHEIVLLARNFEFAKTPREAILAGYDCYREHPKPSHITLLWGYAGYMYPSGLPIEHALVLSHFLCWMRWDIRYSSFCSFPARWMTELGLVPHPDTPGSPSKICLPSNTNTIPIHGRRQLPARLTSIMLLSPPFFMFFRLSWLHMRKIDYYAHCYSNCLWFCSHLCSLLWLMMLKRGIMLAVVLISSISLLALYSMCDFFCLDGSVSAFCSFCSRALVSEHSCFPCTFLLYNDARHHRLFPAGDRRVLRRVLEDTAYTLFENDK